MRVASVGREFVRGGADDGVRGCVGDCVSSEDASFDDSSAGRSGEGRSDVSDIGVDVYYSVICVADDRSRA